MTLVLESELMSAAVMAKIGGWQTLEQLAPQLGREQSMFAHLVTQTEVQIETIDCVYEHARRNAFRKDNGKDIAS